MIRRLIEKDRAQLVDVINSIDLFKPEEKKVAVELVDETLEIEEHDEFDYNIFVYEEDGKILGYHCTGKRYMTEGVFDLYWIVVNSSFKKKGIGTKLLRHSEEFVKKQNGYLILAETSSLNTYNDTRQFYLKNNYDVLAEIKNFYKVNDNLLIFGKYLIT